MDLHERGKNSTHVVERRNRVMTDEDIKELAKALHEEASNHVASCRFSRIQPENMEKAIEFCEKINRIMDNSASLAGKTVLVLVVTAIVGTLFAGFIVRIKDSLRIPMPPGL